MAIMPLLACGINHKTTPLSVREKVVFPHENMAMPLLHLMEQTKVDEAAILSTCNRTEIYCNSRYPDRIIHWLQQQCLSADELTPHLYVHQDQAVVRHILRVASGLDSMVIGEPQILGQVKTAVSVAKKAGAIGQQLRHLFDYVFSAAKQVRTQTHIGSHPISIAFAAVDQAKHIFANITKINVLLIGAGETITLAARHLQSAGVKNFAIANRTPARAAKLAEEISAQILNLGQLSDYLAKTDMVVTATASQLPILGKGMVERALKVRKRRMMCMIDLAVPRDIEPEVANLEDVYLYTLDDLQSIIQQNLQHRQTAAQGAEAIIDLHTRNYMQSVKALEATPLIRAYREKAALLRDIELEKAQRLLQMGIAPEEALKRFAQGLTNKLLHTPTVQMRKAVIEDQADLLRFAKKLFNL